jgi:hypothetical protein
MKEEQLSFVDMVVVASTFHGVQSMVISTHWVEIKIQKDKPRLQGELFARNSRFRRGLVILAGKTAHVHVRC